MKQQVISIHGGEVFDSYKEYINFLKEYKLKKEKPNKKRWPNFLQKNLGEKFEVLLPKMPNDLNAKYLEWKIWFEKLFPFLNKEVILIGGSLGGIFLVKYLSENKFPKKIKGLFLVAPPFDDKDYDYSLADFNFKIKNLKNIEKQCKQINIYHSKDDPIVPFEDFKKYKKYLPKANFYEFKNRQHFGQEKFPEIIKDIKNLFK